MQSSGRPIIVLGIGLVLIFADCMKIVSADSFLRFQPILLLIFLTDFYQYLDLLLYVATNLLLSGVTDNQSNVYWFVYNEFVYTLTFELFYFSVHL